MIDEYAMTGYIKKDHVLLFVGGNIVVYAAETSKVHWEIYYVIST